MSQSVAFMYGFTEGQWHGKHFRRILREHGYKVIADPKLADIIIAHSAGAFYVPELRKEQLLLLINPPYWPERTPAERGRDMLKQMRQAVRRGNEPFYHIHKTARNAMYLVRHQTMNREIATKVHAYNLAAEVTHRRTVLIRNSNDPWLTPHLDHLAQINPYLKIHHISGGHDDCWQFPERYIHLLQSDHDKIG